MNEPRRAISTQKSTRRDLQRYRLTFQNLIVQNFRFQNLMLNLMQDHCSRAAFLNLFCSAEPSRRGDAARGTPESDFPPPLLSPLLLPSYSIFALPRMLVSMCTAFPVTNQCQVIASLHKFCDSFQCTFFISNALMDVAGRDHASTIDRYEFLR